LFVACYRLSKIAPLQKSHQKNRPAAQLHQTGRRTAIIIISLNEHISNR
jgi:hypothetical protein